MTIEELQELLKQAEECIRRFELDEVEKRALQIISLINDSATTEKHAREIEVVRATALHLLSTVVYNRDEWDIALEYLNQTLLIREEIDDRAGVAKSLGSFAVYYQNISEYGKAIEYATRALSIDTELDNKKGIANHLGNIGIAYRRLSDFSRAIEFLSKALQIDEEIGNKSGISRHNTNLGAVYEELAEYLKALECYSIALGIDEELGDEMGIAILYGGIGNIFVILSDFPKALEYFSKALHTARKLNSKFQLTNLLSSIGVVYAELHEIPQALQYFHEALGYAEELDAKMNQSSILGNIGTAYKDRGDYAKAQSYFVRALEISENTGHRSGIAFRTTSVGIVAKCLGDFQRAFDCFNRSLQLQEELGLNSDIAITKNAIGELYLEAEWSRHDDVLAEKYLLEAIALNDKLNLKKYDSFRSLADLYKRQERWKECQEHYEKYVHLKEEVQSEEAKKSAALLEQRRQIAEREKEIAIAQAAASAKLSATTTLLHRVLPETIASRMIDGEEIADYFTSVSILFADIAGFTPISAEMPAIVVVRFLNFVFAEFDRIIKKHGCEKIKTIGDGYMAVCGAPVECVDHAERMAAAALEMQEPIMLPESIREHMPEGIELGVRIGLHTGAIVAGVIGEERFVYDIYSDAVNTAARMESQGEENKIHVSNDFYRHLQNRFAMTKDTSHGMSFVKRGEMEIKGKGMMRTYFLENAQ